jgi:hypothetical protein
MSYTICPTAEEMKMIENMSKKDVMEFLKVTLLAPFTKPRPEINFTLCQKCVVEDSSTKMKNDIQSAEDANK